MIFVQQAGRAAAEQIADRIGAETLEQKALIRIGQDLAQQRITPIAAAHAARKSLRHHEREFAANACLGGQADELEQVCGCAQGLADLAAPVRAFIAR